MESANGLQEISCILAILTEKQVLRMPLMRGKEWPVYSLCSDKAGFINGENICIDGGMTRQMIYHGDNGWWLKKVDEQ